MNTKIPVYKLVVTKSIEGNDESSNHTKTKIYVDKKKAFSAAYNNIKKADDKIEFNKYGRYQYEFSDSGNTWKCEIRVEKSYIDFTKDVIYSY